MAACFLLLMCFMRITGAPPALVKNLVRGAALRVASEITVGLPCENWKIRGNVHTNETSIQALTNVGRFQGGLRAYWKGAGPRLTDGIFSGALLLAGKEGTRKFCMGCGMPPIAAGIAGGLAGGMAQTVNIIAPFWER